MIYLIPGLGYNQRIFEKLDFGDRQTHCLNWIDPMGDETISNYALRLGKPILDSNEPVIIIGHSFGGVIAQEIAAQISIQKVILLGSIKSKAELPFQFKMVKWFRLWNVFTKKMTIQSVKYWGADHGFETENEIELFKEMVGSCSELYLKWALRQLVRWQGVSIPNTTKLVQVHGTKDKTFPYQKIIDPDFSIDGGSHIFLYKRADELIEIIQSEIKKTHHNG